jgi:hypothetical protein
MYRKKKKESRMEVLDECVTVYTLKVSRGRNLSVPAVQ